MAEAATLLGPAGEPLTTPSDEMRDLREQLASARETARVAEKNAEFLAYHVLNAYADDDDMPHRDRLKLVRLSRDVWRRDPQAGRAVNLLNDFTFGRGAPKPKARDARVQEVLDEAWDDPQNQRALTSWMAQREKGTDLAIQSNLYFLLFDDGDDGKVRLGTLVHDSVSDVVRDPENRHRVLYYKATESRVEWDYENDRPRALDGGRPQVRYYQHWANVDEAEEQGETVERPPDAKMGEGLVYHVSVNKTTEMAFGHPEFHRVTRWFSAFNELMASRVTVQKAKSAFLMKRKTRGSPSTVARIATQALGRRGEVGAADVSDAPMPPPRPGSILNENDAISHEPFTISAGSGEAAADGDLLLGQVAAGTGWPKPYLGGDPGSLAGATSLELPVLKLVESRQEAFEGVFRWFIDRVIERAVETGRLDRELGPGEAPGALQEAHEDKAADERSTERDLGYEFALPQPLKRTLADFITAIANVAKTFDPNGSNLELSRLMLGIALSEGFEVEEAQDAVMRIFPEGYVDPAIAAFQAQQAAQPKGRGAPTPPAPPGGPQDGSQDGSGAVGADGKRHGEGNPYGAKRRATPPEKVAQEALAEARTPAGVLHAARGRGDDLADGMERDVWAVAERELERAERRALAGANGHTNGGGRG